MKRTKLIDKKCQLVDGNPVSTDTIEDTKELRNAARKGKKRKKSKRITDIKILFPPVHSGCKSRNVCHLDLISLSSYMPVNLPIPSRSSLELVGGASLGSGLGSDSNELSEARETITSDINEVTSSRIEIINEVQISPLPSPSSKYSVESLKLVGKMNILPGCKPDEPAAEKLAVDFPSLSRVDIVRFLVARKGDYVLAKEMIQKEREWHNATFPVKKEDVGAAFLNGCFFPFGYATNGSPVVYMRGGLYDSNAATPEQYVLAAAHIIEYALEQSKFRPVAEGGDGTRQVNVTVLVQSEAVAGQTGTGADMTFIKLFTKVLSDNYPERLRTLVIYPFPWYGRAIWGVAKVFVDKRTQDKVQLLSAQGSGKSFPPELLALVSLDQMPTCVGGTNRKPIVDLFATLQTES